MAFTLPTKDDGPFVLPEPILAALRAAYPQVEIEREIGKMVLWLTRNASRQPKNHKSIHRFIHTWMKRAAGESTCGAKTLDEFLALCQRQKRMPIDMQHPVWEWAQKSGVPDEFVVLAWDEFKDRYRDTFKHRDWPHFFFDYVALGRQRIWYRSDAAQGYSLTTAGKQRKLAQQNVVLMPRARKA